MYIDVIILSIIILHCTVNNQLKVDGTIKKRWFQG